MNRNKKRIPNMPHSLDSAAKVLDIDRENILTWVLDGSIRACINYRTYFSDSLTYSVAVLSNYTNIIEEFKEYRNDELSINCPLSPLLSTEHSTILINAHSVSLITNDNSTSFSADLKGLWHINELTDVEELYDNMNNDNPTYVNIVPYIPESIYNSGVNDDMADYILGFNVEVSFDDICISYEDIRRIEAYLNSNVELKKIGENQNIIEPKFTGQQQLAMALVQLIESDLNLGAKSIETANTSLAKIERLRAINNHSPLILENRKFSALILMGKRLLKNNHLSGGNEKDMQTNNAKKLRKQFLPNSKTLVQIIESHSLFDSKIINDPENAYKVINKKLNLKMDEEVFIEILNDAKNH